MDGVALLNLSALRFKVFEVLTAVTTKSSTFLHITMCSPVKVNWCLGRRYHHHQGQGVTHACSLLHAGFLLWPWGWKWYVPLKHWLSWDNNILYHRRYNSSWCFDFRNLMANLTCPEAHTPLSLCVLWTSGSLFSGRSASPTVLDRNSHKPALISSNAHAPLCFYQGNPNSDHESPSTFVAQL